MLYRRPVSQEKGGGFCVSCLHDHLLAFSSPISCVHVFELHISFSYDSGIMRIKVENSHLQR